MKKSIIILQILLLFFLQIFLAYSLSLEKSEYLLNEVITINIDEELENMSLSIISPNHYYNFLGIPENKLVFQPTEKGQHFIELYLNNELFKKIDFNVTDNSEKEEIASNQNLVNKDYQSPIISQNASLFNSTVLLNSLYNPITINVKKNYTINENIIIILTKNNENFNISKLIISADKEYIFDNPKNTIIFKPKTTGLHNIFVYDSFNNELAKDYFLVLEQKQYRIINSKKSDINGTFFFKDKITKNISEIFIETKNEKLNLDYLPNLKNIKKISFKNLNLDNGFDLGLEDIETDNLNNLNKNSNRNFIKAYAINPENLDFTEAVLTSVAQGKTLYKCAEWDFFSQTCNGVWKKIMTLIPGQEYNVIITKNDPAYAENNEIPEPKPVTGFIFMSDNTRANNGIPVSIFNKANNEYVFTQVYAPPIPIYKGAYSANIYGITGDSIVVKSWNSTHYGETNATLLATTTYVNVTIQYSKGSEPNVSIIYPLNNSIFYLGQNFNVTAKVQILNNNAENCYASFVSTLAEPITGQSNTIFLGDILQNNEITFMFNLSAIKGGYEKLIVNVSCLTDTILEGLNIAKVNLSFIDNVKPEITIFKPLTNEESLNPVKFIFNVSDHTGIKNCSLIFNGNLNQTIFNPQIYLLHSFNLTLQAGTYNYNIECYDNSTLFNYNITETINFFLPSWHFYYGNISSKIFLGSGDIEKYSWENYLEAYLYVIETNTIVDWNNLQALGRDKFNNSDFNDFNEADINLSMQNFVDSINNTFTQNYQPKKLVNLTIFGKRINNIPVINSTNNSNFITGILWEMNGNNYNGSQNLIFFTNKSIAKQGKFGLYEYEIRIPANLKNYKLNSGTITFYTEII